MRTPFTEVTTLVLIILVGCILCSARMYAKDNYKVKKYAGLKGKIVSVRDTLYDCTFMGFLYGQKEIAEVQVLDFDKDGNCVREMSYNADSTHVVVIERTYSNDTLKASRSQVYDGQEVFRTTSEYITTDKDTLIYKESNNTQQWKKKMITAGKYRMEFSNDEYGCTKEEIWADDNDNIVKTSFVLVSNDMTFANGTNTIEKVSTMKYDKDGNVTESSYAENKDMTKSVYSYHQFDKYGNWTEERAIANEYFKKLRKRTIKYVE